MVKFRIQKLKVVRVVRYLEELVFRIKQSAGRLQKLFLVLITCTSMNSRRRTVHRGVTSRTMTICTTTQISPPQDPVTLSNLVSVYLHRNVHESMEMNQTMEFVSVELEDVLLVPVFIVPNLLVRVLLDHLVLKPMVLLLIPLRVDVAVQDVLLNRIATNL